MIVTIDPLLDAGELATARSLLASASWSDGRITAGTQAVAVLVLMSAPVDRLQAQQTTQALPAPRPRAAQAVAHPT